MSTTTILHELERRLAERQTRDEIAPGTRDTYLNDASRVVEVLLRHIPAPVIEGYMQADGYQGDYGTIIRTLQAMARTPGHLTFPE